MQKNTVSGLNKGICVRDLKDDFRYFLAYAWNQLKLPSPTPIQLEIAEWLQHGPNRRGIKAFRGVGKSWETSTYVDWKLWNNPQVNILVVSASKNRSDNFSLFTQRLIYELKLLQHLKPPSNDDKYRWSKIAFDVYGSEADHAPSVMSIGITGMMTGSRADLIIADDIEIPNNSMTEELREKLKDRCGEFNSILKPEGEIVFLGTPQTEHSVYTALQEEKGFTFKIWPARVPHESKLATYKGALAESIEARVLSGTEYWKPTDPRRFDEEDLLEREVSMGKSQFMLQFMLDTTLSDAERYPLKTSDLIVMDLDKEKGPGLVQYGSGPEQKIKELPNLGLDGDRFYRPFIVEKELIEYEGSMMYIDPSGRGEDETAVVIVNQLHGYLFLMDVRGFKGGYTDLTLVKISKLARDYNVKLVLIEPNYGGGMFSEVLKPVLRQYHNVAVEDDDWSNAQKECRIIDTLEPVMNRHRLIIAREIITRDIEIAKENRLYSFFYQMTRLTKDRGSLKFDDKIDALAGAVRYWMASLARNEKESLNRYRSKMMDQEIEKFITSAKRLHPNHEYFNPKKRNKGKLQVLAKNSKRRRGFKKLA